MPGRFERMMALSSPSVELRSCPYGRIWMFDSAVLDKYGVAPGGAEATVSRGRRRMIGVEEKSAPALGFENEKMMLL
jgi:hypothetical protein